jgi:hypothetical protein
MEDVVTPHPGFPDKTHDILNVAGSFAAEDSFNDGIQGQIN